MTERKICFVIAPIGEPDSETRRRSDQILRHVITPAVGECGYEPIRADHISEPGIITSQVIQHVVDDPLVIADLTDRNPNVFYELAIRHAIRKPLVQIIRKGEPLPFDVAGTRTISVDIRDLDSVEEAKREIVNQVRAVERNALEIDTPISVALDLQLLKQSDNPEQRSLADILSTLSEIRSSIASIEKRIDHTEFSGSRDMSASLANKYIWSRSPFLRENLSPEQLDMLSEYAILLKAQLKHYEANREQLRKLQEKTKTETEDKSAAP